MNLRKTDVLLGRGKSTSFWHGNVSFRRIVWKHRGLFANGDRHEKQAAISSVWKHIKEQNPPGRFLERMDNGHYKVADPAKQMEKIRQALREKYAARPFKKEVRLVRRPGPPGANTTHQKNNNKNKKKHKEPTTPIQFDAPTVLPNHRFSSDLQKNAVAQVLMNMMWHDDQTTNNNNKYGPLAKTVPDWIQKQPPPPPQEEMAGCNNNNNTVPPPAVTPPCQDLALEQKQGTTTTTTQTQPGCLYLQPILTSTRPQQGDNNNGGGGGGGGGFLANECSFPNHRELPLHLQKFMALLRGPLPRTITATTNDTLLDDIDDDIWNVLTQ